MFLLTSAIFINVFLFLVLFLKALCVPLEAHDSDSVF